MRYLLAAALASLAILPASCDTNAAPDTVPPQIGWVYPRDGDTVDPGVYTLTAVATDDRGVDFVVFFAGPEMLGMVRTTETDTYKVAVECLSDTSRVYELLAFAYDKEPNGTSASIIVHVRR
ncbi:hypothetical protein FJY68_03720 [candidate division WOR-3 bacterium]|uniref:Lipoprotein n=1 Tax=candidate division WOR-3 bacterium TaxID=2052148 RepID=A0A938BSQ0_UNCW3|nr:hypothetical protein [candidate division WOR-3 bacterium]